MDWRQSRDCTGVLYLLDTAHAAGLDVGSCLVGSSLDEAELRQRGALIEAWQELAVIRNLLQQGAKPGLGLDAGSRYHLTSLGMLGFTMLACRSLLEAYETLGRFQSLALTLCPVSLVADVRGAWLCFDDTVVPEDARRFVVERGVAGSLQLSRELAQRRLQPLAVELKGAALDELAPFARLMDVAPTFQAPRNGLLLSWEDLHAALPQAQLSARQVGEQLCEQLCRELELTLVSSPLARQVQQLLIRDSASLLGSAEVAARLGLSERTLQRRLAEEGHALQGLNDGIKRRLAERLLRESRMDLQGVAQCLGYAEAASFSRAFQRWTGLSPGRWKRSHGVSITLR